MTMTEELPQCLHMSASRQGKVCSILPSVCTAPPLPSSSHPSPYESTQEWGSYA